MLVVWMETMCHEVGVLGIVEERIKGCKGGISENGIE